MTLRRGTRSPLQARCPSAPAGGFLSEVTPTPFGHALSGRMLMCRTQGQPWARWIPMYSKRWPPGWRTPRQRAEARQAKIGRMPMFRVYSVSAPRAADGVHAKLHCVARLVGSRHESRSTRHGTRPRIGTTVLMIDRRHA